MQFNREFALAAGFAAVVGAATASADISDPAVVFSASSSLGSGSIVVSPDDGVWDGSTWFWMAMQPIEIRSDSGALILTLTQGSVFMDEDPVIGIGFAVLAGGADTTFGISSGTLSFATIPDAWGRASAGVTLTESNGDTATLSGALGGSAYQADTDLGTFTSLLAGSLAEGTAFGTADASDEFPGGGGFAAMGAVSQMSVDWGFELTARDQASGTSVFVVVPAPASLALLMAGGAACARRRR